MGDVRARIALSVESGARWLEAIKKAGAMACALLLIACGDDTNNPRDAAASDAGTRDATAQDTGFPDANPADAGGGGPWQPTFSVTARPAFEEPYSVVGDPSVVRSATGDYLMYHHCLDVDREPAGGEVCLAISSNGRDWVLADTPLGTTLVPGRVLSVMSGGWDEAHETPLALEDGDGVVLYFLGYQGDGFFGVPGSSRIGRATSTDGLSFTREPTVPVLTPRDGAEDAYGVTSPSMVELADGTLVLYYTGWCVAPLDCPRGDDSVRLSLLAATSTDGIGFVHRSEVVVGDPDLPWAGGGISEATVVQGPDDRFYLFFSSLPGEEGSEYEQQRIGVAWSASPYGPFVFAEDPIVSPEDLGAWGNGGALAPDVMFEDDEVHMWFHAFELDAGGEVMAARIGHATAEVESVLTTE